MKFWRTTAVVALVTAFSAATAFAALAPKAPAAATGAQSAPGSITCEKETDKTLVDGLTQCPGYVNATSSFVGNGFPWENSAFFFSSFRNQYLYDSSALTATYSIACTMETLQARSTSFTGGSTNVYASHVNGADSFIRVNDGFNSLVSTFAINTAGTRCELLGNDTNPIIIGTTAGPGGATVSTCLSCPGADYTERDAWCQIDLEAGIPSGGVVVDANVSVGAGNAGAGVWDTDGGGGQCTPAGLRAFGSGSFINPDHLTTAFGIDDFDFVWVFRGKAPPPPATVEQQIKEIVRLLLTPEGLRCSGLDTSPGDSRIEDFPVAYPGGASIDPIQPQITTGQPKTGDELVDGLRNAGFRP